MKSPSPAADAMPRATYRVQFRPEFGFAACRRIIGYLSSLGISHLYASPIFRARPGSTHGYDVCDHRFVNPELGGQKGLDSLLTACRRRDLGWIQDIVPNHMAVSGDNPCLVDLLENGPASRYFGFFDIDWEHPLENIRGRMLAPFLGDTFGGSLERGEIFIGFDEGGFFARYYDLRLPLRIDSYAKILTRVTPLMRRELGSQEPDLVKLLGILYTIRSLSVDDAAAGRYEQIAFLKRLLFDLYQGSSVFRVHLDRQLAEINGSVKGKGAERFDALEALLADQYFRLSYWKVAAEEINYRRFFVINDLICLRAEKEDVFFHTHRLLLEKIRDGAMSGLRVDHIDGFYDPTAYLQELRDHVGETYVVVEKILTGREPLPAQWPVQGTTGYDFLNTVGGLFVDSSRETAFDRCYRSFSGVDFTAETLAVEKKARIIQNHMAGDVDNLARLVNKVSSRDRHAFDITFASLRRAITALMVQFPVYRTYINFDGFRPEDLGYIRDSIRRARRETPALGAEFDFLERFLLLDFDERMDADDRHQWIHFVMRFQQVTAPVMAKGVEDSVFYAYNRLLCLNEVGGQPARFGTTGQEFHAFLRTRARQWPATMNATATHDHKRGEDARMRLAALSEIPDRWQSALKLFSRVNARKKNQAGGRPAPDRNDEYFLYQTLVATWPSVVEGFSDYARRIDEYLVKALREAKERTSWLQPDEEYENACRAFAGKLLRNRSRSAFVREMEKILDRIVRPAATNSLAQTLIKITAPGVPDFYQGTELWDFSLVDPDNRRPVDFALRKRLLDRLQKKFENDPESLAGELLENFADGRVKLFVLWRALAQRNHAPALFGRGRYLPLSFQGPLAGNLFGFARMLEGQAILVVLPRFMTVATEGAWSLGCVWDGTGLVLPGGISGPLVDTLTGRRISPAGRVVAISELLKHYPVALVTRFSGPSPAAPDSSSSRQSLDPS